MPLGRDHESNGRGRVLNIYIYMNPTPEATRLSLVTSFRPWTSWSQQRLSGKGARGGHDKNARPSTTLTQPRLRRLGVLHVFTWFYKSSVRQTSFIHKHQQRPGGGVLPKEPRSVTHHPPVAGSERGLVICS